MAVSFPVIETIEDANAWCQELYKELKQPFVTYSGNRTVWDDYVTPITEGTFLGASNNPTLTKVFDDGSGSTGVYTYVFSDGDEGLMTIQMPHKWKEGSRIYPHIHYFVMTDVSPADNFKIEFEYTWQSEDNDFPATTILTETTRSTGVNYQYKHEDFDIPAGGIDGTGHTISSILLCRIKRTAADSDNYAGGVAILDFDIHYEIDTHGSRDRDIK
jgi:hypothetical protein